MSDTVDTTTRPPGTLVRFDVYSHHVQVTDFNHNVLLALYDFCRTIAQYGLIKVNGRFRRGMKKVFVGVTNDRDAFSFHINDFRNLKRFLQNRNIGSKQWWTIHHPLYTPGRYTMTYHDTRTPRAVQSDAIDYILKPRESEDDSRAKLIPMGPGEGKTFIALYALNALEVRAFFCIKPMYIHKWIRDIKEAFAVEENDVMVVQGSGNFKKMLALAAAGELEAKIILCSNSTYFQYIKYYERYKKEILNMGFACLPWQMHELLDVGIHIIDEVHQDFHLNFRQDVYSHVPLTLAMSGSVEHDDPFINNRNQVMFPDRERFKGSARVVHVVAEALIYETPDVDQRFSYMNHSLNAYSHSRYEKSIRKRKKTLRAYFQMCRELLHERFIERSKPGQKGLIFFSRKSMCTDFTEELKNHYPDLNIQRYIEGDDYDEMLTGDIVVSTLRSMGTAIDLPGLRTLLKTDALSTLQGNIQVLGRIRPLDNPEEGEHPEFLYLVNRDIEKHLTYMEKKKKTFRGRVVAHREIETGYVI